MRLSLSAALLAGASMASAAVLPLPTAIPLSTFQSLSTPPLSLDEIFNGGNKTEPEPTMKLNLITTQATCGNPRIRREWDNYPTASRQNFINAIKCLQNKAPSGRYAASKSKYEDLVALHQGLTPNVHGNAKFLVWHRYYLWTFEQLLRDECGFTAELPWFDETKYAGRFAQSSIFSGDWFGAIAINGQCVTNGQFANLAINIGPGSTNRGPYCLARAGDGTKTANCNAQVVAACNQRTGYADMAGCSEGAAHAFGHNGIGAVMQDRYSSPADPVFFLHHAFIDRNFRVWQNANVATRTTTIDGNDAFGNRLTMDTGINVGGIRPDTKIRNVMNTLDTTLCYRYDY